MKSSITSSSLKEKYPGSMEFSAITFLVLFVAVTILAQMGIATDTAYVTSVMPL